MAKPEPSKREPREQAMKRMLDAHERGEMNNLEEGQLNLCDQCGAEMAVGQDCILLQHSEITADEQPYFPTIFDLDYTFRALCSNECARDYLATQTKQELPCAVKDWSPSQDISAAFELVEKMISDGFEIEMGHEPGAWYALFVSPTNKSEWFLAEEQTLPLAITKAALEAVRNNE